MKVITRNVISYCDIPQELTENHWINEFQNGCYVSFNIDVNNPNNLDKWFIDNHPELIGYTFLIEIDY